MNKMCTVRPETWQKWHGAAGRLDHVPVAERTGQRRESAEGHRHPVRQRRLGRPRRVHRRNRAGLHRPDERARARSASPTAIWEPPTAGPTMASPMSAPATSPRSPLGDPATIYNLYKQFYSPPNFTWGNTLGAGQAITQANRNPILGGRRAPTG